MTDTAQAEVVYDEREQGIYPAVFTGCSNFDYTDAATGQLELRWRWVFADDRGEFDTLTSRSFAPGTNALKFFRGLLGRDPSLRIRGTLGTYEQADLVVSASTPIAAMHTGASESQLLRSFSSISSLSPPGTG